MYSSWSSKSTLAPCLEEHSSFTVIAVHCMSRLVLLHTQCIFWACNWGVLGGLLLYTDKIFTQCKYIWLQLSQRDQTPLYQLRIWSCVLKNSLMREGPIYLLRGFVTYFCSSPPRCSGRLCFFICLVSPKSLTKANSTRERDSCFCIY